MITTDCVDVTTEVEAVNGADEEPAGIVTEAGNVTTMLLSERLTIAPPEGAGPERVTVQVLEVPPVTVAGEHRIEEIQIPAAVTAKVAVCDTPP